MSVPTTTPEAADDILRPQVCPRCDYSLAGHPGQGVCPECGREYDCSIVILYGDPAGRKARKSVLQSSVQLALQLTVFALFATLFGWQGLVTRRMPPGPTLFFGMICLFWAANIVRSVIWWYRGAGSGEAQVKLGPEGFAQGQRQLGPIPYEHCDKIRFIPWRKAKEVELVILDNGRLRIRIIPPRLALTRHNEYVHATVRCTLDQFVALARRTAAWRKLAAEK